MVLRPGPARAPYHSFERGGWKFICLDSITQRGNGYTGRLDDEQFEWLTAELADTPRTQHVLISSHIPILLACAQLGTKDPEGANRWETAGGVMHVDARKLLDLFLKHPNVRLCISGHLHQLERIDYQNVSYICDGAVSGAWWKGKNRECVEGYGLFDLYDDGTFAHQYVLYGWQAAPEEPGAALRLRAFEGAHPQFA